MSYTAQKISGNQVELTFSIPAEQFEEAMQKAYLRDRNRISVPGFRKGKAPRKLIERMYSEAVFYDAAFDILFPDAYAGAVEAEKLDVVDQPSVDVKEIGSGKALEFTATVYVMPDVELGSVEGMKLTKYLPEVTDEQVNARMERDMAKVTSLQDVADRPVKEGDTVSLDYAGTVDGVAFEGGTAERQTLKIGSGSFIPGFEEQMVGMNAGEDKDIHVTFPADYHAEELAGKEAVFHVKVNAIQEEVRPEMDDDFAKDVSEHQTFDEYKEGLRKELTEQTARNADTRLENELVQKLVDASECDIPDAMIERELDAQLRSMKLRMAYQGIRFEDYVKYTGMDEHAIRDMYRADAKNTVKTQLVLDALRKQRSIEVTPEEVDAEIERYAGEIGRNVDEYRATLSDEQRKNFSDIVASRKAIEQIKGEVEITVSESEEPGLDVAKAAEAVAEAAQQADEAGEEETEKPAKARKTRKEKAENAE